MILIVRDHVPQEVAKIMNRRAHFLIRFILVLFFLTGFLMIYCENNVAQESNNLNQMEDYSGLSSPQVGSGAALGSPFHRSPNSLVFSLSGSINGNDNIFYSSGGNKYYDTYGSIGPRLAYQREYRRGLFAMDYQLNADKYVKYNQLDRFSHVGGFDFRYLFTPRLAIAGGDRFQDGVEPARYLQTDSILDQNYGSLLPNDSLVGGATRRLNNTAFLVLSYSLSRKSSLQFGINNSISRYDQIDVPLPVFSSSYIDSNQYGANVSFTRNISAKLRFILGYQFNYYGFLNENLLPDTVPSSTLLARTHSGTVGLAYSFSKSISGDIQAGAIQASGFYRSQPQGGSSANYSNPYLNIDGGIHLQKTSDFLSIRFHRSISDGGGIAQLSLTQGGDLSLGHHFARRLTTSVSGGYFYNQYLQYTISLPYNNRSEGFSVSPDLRADLHERFSIHANYRYIKQHYAGPLTTAFAPRMNSNTFSVGFSYNLIRGF